MNHSKKKYSFVIFVSLLRIVLSNTPEADLEGACAPPPPKIRKAYIIQR